MATVTTQSGRPLVFRVVIGSFLLIPALLAVFWDEILLAGPIIFLVEFFGFWLGYIIFCLSWAMLGILFLNVGLRIWPWVRRVVLNKEAVPVSEAQSIHEYEAKNWRERLVLKLARMMRFLGTLATSVLLGPTFGWPVFKLLGYSERQVYAWTFASAWIFGAIWVPFYALGVWGFGISNLVRS